ncbi:MAG: LuxR C-terminal-related transcriptional regulator [Clostridium sp.]|nr:LuxR C-terminal-related transcriptional regulator [Prevotella sp.]MCM1428752.1 LuxR C-terminal-related transcriptional regulator [Clostridium sp.]MCM1475127.1 LuxR C-terminal-related transcriptional regulator [Muribaculaceae bacterium]
MSNHIAVAIIGLSTIENIAVKEVLRRIPSVSTDTFADCSFFMQNTQQFQAYVCDSESYLLNSSFFFPRKDRTVVVFSAKTPHSVDTASIDSEPFIIYHNSDEAYLERSLRHIVKQAKSSEEPSADLSSREKEVLRLIAGGLANKEIADRLNISVNTAITHRKNISTKLGIKSASGLSIYALMSGII